MEWQREAIGIERIGGRAKMPITLALAPARPITL
jgi:hypothetical protein